LGVVVRVGNHPTTTALRGRRDALPLRRPADFHRLIDHDQLLEWADFAGNLYGTPREPVERSIALGTPALLKIDLQGARQVRKAMSDARLVFLAPPSYDELARRLTGRGTEDPATIAAASRTPGGVGGRAGVRRDHRQRLGRTGRDELVGLLGSRLSANHHTELTNFTLS
jgi:guanylate kinase